MAKKKSGKKKEKIETKEVTVDLTQLASENDKYIGDLAKFFEERIEDLKTVRDGNSLKLTVSANLSRRKIKQYIKKFLYLANLTDSYRPIALQLDEKGYEIHKRITAEE